MPEVHLIGEIQGATGFQSSKLYLHYKVVSSTEHWHVLEGDTEGYTQVDESNALGVGSGDAVWNHPIDVHFGADSMQGWPKLQVEVWGLDRFDRNELMGYGMCFVPPTPGVHLLDCVTWRPRGGLEERWTAAFLGAPPTLKDSRVVTSTAGRHQLSTETAGTVLLQLSVLLAGFAERNTRLGRVDWCSPQLDG